MARPHRSWCRRPARTRREPCASSDPSGPGQLVARIATSPAPKAGLDVAEVDVDRPLPAPVGAAWANRRRAVAEPVLDPLLLALGATIPGGAEPVAAHLPPRAIRPPTGRETAAMLAALLGTRPSDLASVTRPINGFTVLAAGATDVPDAYVPTRAIDAIVTAIGSLRPVNVSRLVGVRATDGRGAAPASPLIAGDDVLLTIETSGTSWRVPASDIRFVLSRPGAADVTLACAIRRIDALVTGPWFVPETEGTIEFSLTARITHPVAGTETLAPVRFSITIARRP